MNKKQSTTVQKFGVSYFFQKNFLIKETRKYIMFPQKY